MARTAHTIPGKPASLFSRIFFYALCLAACMSGTALSPDTAFAAAAADVCRTGSFPTQGRMVIRSGLAWMNETAPAFQTMARGLEKELTSLGLTIVPYAKPSKLEAMPETPLQPNANGSSRAAPSAPARKGPAVTGEAAKEKSDSLAKEGRLPKLKLRSYSTPQRDADLPQTVKDVRPPDVTRALYARSQELGRPVVQNFAIPGRIPEELESDSSYADYVLVVRFASVRSWGAAPGSAFPGINVAFASTSFLSLPGTLVAAAPLGYGPPASPSSSAPPNTYGTPGGFIRGYEGSAPNDFWGRDRDYFQRDYMLKHGEQPQYAKPPKDLSPGYSGPGTHQGFGSAPEFGGRHTMNIDEWILIFIDCYDVAPARNGQKPVVVWSVSARKPVQGEPFAKGVETLARAAFAANARQK